MTPLTVLSIIAVLVLCAISFFFKLFKKYPLDPKLIAKFDEEKRTVSDLIYSAEQKMSCASPYYLKKLNEIKDNFQETIKSAETTIGLNNKNFESSLKIDILNINLIKNRIGLLLSSHKITTSLGTCNSTLNEAARMSAETLKKINSSQHPLALIPKPATLTPKTHGALYGVPDPEHIEKATTPKQIGPIGIVPQPPSSTPEIPDDSKKDPAS